MFGAKLLTMICAAAIALSAGDALAQSSKKKKKEEQKKEEVVADPSKPDLVILASETELTVGGCNVGDVLLTGTVAIKNNSPARADRLIKDPLTAVYIPEFLDLKDEDIVPNSLAGKEILSTDVIIGKDRIKEKRGLKGKRTVFIVVDPYNKIAEGNETNNVLKREVTFNCK